MKARSMVGLVAASLVLMFAFATAAKAADEKKAAATATGTWKWSREFNGNTMNFTLKLVQDGEKLTGAMQVAERPETKIEEGKVTGSDVSFQVTRERTDGTKNTTKYTAKLEGDVLKCKSVGTFNGQERTTEFEAKRAKE